MLDKSRCLKTLRPWLKRMARAISEPERAAAFGGRLIEGWRRRRGRAMLNREYAAIGPAIASRGSRAVLADAIWDNPNHYFRLRLFLRAIGEPRLLIGVLRSREDIDQRRSLEAIGFSKFYFLEDADHNVAASEARARVLLEGVTSHADLLKIELPDGMPAYVFYDTVLKNTRAAQPPIDDPIWFRTLARSLRFAAFYQQIMQENSIELVVYSHPWKIEFGCAAWAAVARAIPFFHLTAYTDTMRVKRFDTSDDYLIAHECLRIGEYESLPSQVRSAAVEAGRDYLEARASGRTTDIDALAAFKPNSRVSDRASARGKLQVGNDRFMAVVYAVSWFDFPHLYGMRNFSDALDWMKFTLSVIRDVPDVDWLLKPHPLESWYSGTRLIDIAIDLPPHVRVIPPDHDSLMVANAADAVVTIHGTIGFEAAANGVAVLCADRSYYSEWSFATEAASREDYACLLRSITAIRPVSRQQSDRAAAFAYFAQAPHPPALGLMSMMCDSKGSRLYPEIVTRLRNVPADMNAEVAALRAWIESGHKSYSVAQKLGYLGAFASADHELSGLSSA